jgi:hypothetical protein
MARWGGRQGGVARAAARRREGGGAALSRSVGTASTRVTIAASASASESAKCEGATPLLPSSSCASRFSSSSTRSSRSSPPNPRPAAGRSLPCSTAPAPGVAQQGEPLEVKGPPNGLDVLHHRRTGESELVGPLRAPAAALVEIEERVVAHERREVGTEPLEIESGAPVEHDDGVEAAAVHPVEEAHASHTCDVTCSRLRLASLEWSHGRWVLGGARGGAKQAGRHYARRKQHQESLTWLPTHVLSDL